MAKGLNRFDEIHAVHMQDIYTHPEAVQDVQWLADSGDAGWFGVTQNLNIPQVPRERAAIIAHGARVYCLARADYPPITQGLIFGRNFVRMKRANNRPGPGFWRVSERPPLRDIT